jgi:cytochrome c oxidase subunit III
MEGFIQKTQEEIDNLSPVELEEYLKAKLEYEKNEKVKKNVLYIGIFSITMFFGGLMSAYVVKMSDGFWLHFTLPSSFWISTALIILSSITLYLALSSAKKGNKTLIKLYVTLTLLLGIGFTVFQYKGWKQLYSMGNMFISPTINNDGQYGRDFSLRYNGDEVYFDGENFLINGEVVSQQVDADITGFGKKLYNAGIKGTYSDVNDDRFIVVHRQSGEHLVFKDGKVMMNGESLSLDIRKDLAAFSHTVFKKVGLFFVKGNYGENFFLTFNTKKVDYENGTFLIDGKPFDSNQEQMLFEHQNVTSTFVYLFSFAHLLHLVGGLIYLMVLLSKSYKGVYDQNNHLQLKLGGIYWHYLDFLWVFLLLFLHFIH